MNGFYCIIRIKNRIKAIISVAYYISDQINDPSTSAVNGVCDFFPYNFFGFKHNVSQHCQRMTNQYSRDVAFAGQALF